MSDPIKQIKGMDEGYRVKLESHGIKTTDQLLEHARTHSKRAELARELGATPTLLKEWVNRADLIRLKGVGGDFANLLEEAGVNSCRELQHRSPEHLLKTLTELQAKHKTSYRLPTLAQVTEWIHEAKTLAATSPE